MPISSMVSLAFAAGAAFSSSSAEGNGVRWALCELDAGCRFCELPVTHAQADLALAALGLIRDAPGHTVTVLRNRAGEWTWYYDNRRTPAELHAFFGGRGIAPKGDCPALPEATHPADGRWTITPGEASTRNCPADLDARVRDSLPLPSTGTAAFERPFRAGMVLPGAAWIQVAPNRHVGAFAPAGADGLRGLYTLDVVSTDLMRGELKVVAPIPGQSTCEIQIPFDYRREGAER